MIAGSWEDWVEEFSIEIPREWLARPFAPTPEDHAAAWELYTELSTRITTQPLHARSGDESTALESVYGLFKLCRELIKKHGAASVHFTDLCRLMLNREIRPFTARWHKRNKAGQLEIDDIRQEFRAQLENLRKKLEGYEFAMRSLATGRTEVTPLAPKPLAAIGACAIPAEILGLKRENDAASQAVEAEMRSAEHRWIAKRRVRAGSHLPALEAEQAGATGFGFVGLALSGGGIRSATFCLGVLQSLARRGVMKDVDYLSTVSGGGYIGSLISTSIAGPQPSASSVDELLKTDSADVANLRARSFHHLLGKQGKERILNVVLMMLQGLATSGSLIALLWAGLVVALTPVFRSHAGEAFFHGKYWGVLAYAWSLFLLLLVLPRRPVESGMITAILARKFLVFSGVVVAIGLTIQLRAAVSALSWQSAWVEYIGLGLTLLGAGSSSFGGPSWLRKVLVMLIPIVLPFTLLWFAIGTAQKLAMETLGTTTLLGGAAVVVYAFIILKAANVNRVSPFQLYRQSLCETYLEDEARRTRIPRLSELSEDCGAPYPLLNAALNIPGTKAGILRGRKSDLFVFSPRYSGSVATKYRKTTTFEKLDESLDLGTAMSISAAAASSHMGSVTPSHLVPLLALLNVRLGYWIRNPGATKPSDQPPGTALLWKEMTGDFDENFSFLNLSDGGHVENLGLYELLRRQCRFIIAIDSEADEAITCAALLKCKQLAFVDLGVEITIDIDDLARNFEGRTRAHFVLGTIRYPSGLDGYLLYVKSSLTGDEEASILDYRRRNPTFPHESTADQFYSEERFEAYRLLGEHIGERLFRDEILSKQGIAVNDSNIDIRQWLDALRQTLLPDDRRERGFGDVRR